MPKFHRHLAMMNVFYTEKIIKSIDIMKRSFIMVLSLTAIFLVACKGKKLIDKQELASQEWILSEFKNGDTLQKLPAEKLTIFFTDTNTVYGMAGCNRFMGRYELSKEKGFVMDPGGMTMMACPDLGFEDIYMKALSGSHFASMENERLIIEGNDGKTVLIYEPYVKEVGVAMDEHGCNAAAGYMWSEVKKDCIRIFETGIRMNSQTDKNATSSAFLVFSPDSLQVELFLPEEDIQPVLDRRSLPKGGYAWNQEDDDTYNVTKEDDIWVISRRGVVLYTSVSDAK